MMKDKIISALNAAEAVYDTKFVIGVIREWEEEREEKVEDYKREYDSFGINISDILGGK